MSEDGAGRVRNPAEEKKNRPTPRRHEQEARNQRPLVGGTQDKDATRKARAEMRRRRDEARVGVMNGDERYLGPRDAGRQRKYVRDYVDARFSIGELFIPIALIVLLAGMFVPSFAMVANFVVYGLILLIILDSILLCTLLRGRIRAKFGQDSIQKGTNFYAIMRAIQIRRLRVPKPMVRRRETPS